MKFFFLRILLPLLLFLLLRAMMKTALANRGSQTARRGSEPPPTVPAGGDLKKDPVCGAYVSPAVSVTRKVDGATVHFCSAECRDKYRVAS